MANNAHEELMERYDPTPRAKCTCRPDGVTDGDWGAHLWRDGHDQGCPDWEYRTVAGDDFYGYGSSR